MSLTQTQERIILDMQSGQHLKVQYHVQPAFASLGDNIVILGDVLILESQEYIVDTGGGYYSLTPKGASYPLPPPAPPSPPVPIKRSGFYWLMLVGGSISLICLMIWLLTK